ncbi:MAG TPA: hypothetical protein VFY71_14960 [Planctomycetota bacterium]|nr:hypothetical protein [Planctomycetota bacterium]
MARRLPASLLRPAGAGGAPRAADDIETPEKDVAQSVPPIVEEIAAPGGGPARTAHGRTRTGSGSRLNRKSARKGARRRR